MNNKCISIATEGIWRSDVVAFLDRELSDNWGNIGLTKEIEARLGKMTDNRFVSGVDMKFFIGMRDYLLSKNYWVDNIGKSVKPHESNEFSIVFEDNVRVIIGDDDSKFSVKEVIKKNMEKKETFSFGENPYCLRLSLAEEKPLTIGDKDSYKKAALDYVSGFPTGNIQVTIVRHRKRTSFNYFNEYVIDMTETQSGDSLRDLQGSPSVFEIECELCIPRHSHCEVLFIYLNCLLRRFLTLPDNLCNPQPQSMFHPNNFKHMDKTSHCPITICGDIELMNSDGYDDELIVWCKQRNKDGKAILPMSLANQLCWSISHTSQMFSLRSMPMHTGASPEQRQLVINNGGTIRSEDGHIFHCCVWQYEGVHLGAQQANLTLIANSSQKRERDT